MNGNDVVDRIRQNAAAAPYQDGLLELFAAVVFLGVAMLWDAGLGYFMGLLAIPIIFGGSAALLWAKKRITHPRLGFVEPKQPVDESKWGGFVFIGTGIVLMIVVVAATGGLGDVEAWRRWAPALAGYLCSGGFWYAAAQSGKVRFKLIGVFSIASGIVVSLGSDGASYAPVAQYALAMAAILLLTGGAVLWRFLREYPLDEGSTP